MKNRLRVRRAQRDGISQMDVARDVGMSFNRYWRIENNHTVPTPEEQALLADYFGVKVTAVFPGAKRTAKDDGVVA
jgi:transcriptional regulator with XRE-family HTH domain